MDSIRIVDLLPLAGEKLGNNASIRVVAVATGSGVSVVASACRSISTGSGAEERILVVHPTEEQALQDLRAKLLAYKS